MRTPEQITSAIIIEAKASGLDTRQTIALCLAVAKDLNQHTPAMAMDGLFGPESDVESH